jgi:PAS domain-containing protein
MTHPRFGRSSVRPQVITIPGSDGAFRDHVAQLEATSWDPDALQRRLRRIFPLAVVRERVLSGEPALYVYRDGRWQPPKRTWWEDSSLPRVVVSSDGWLTEANRSAAELLEIDPGSAPEHHFTDFVVPGSLDDAIALFRVVDGGHPLSATIQLRPSSGSAVAIDLHAARHGSGVVGVFRLADGVEPTVDDIETRLPATVITIPATDVAFRGYVLRALRRMPEPTTEGLDLRLRRLYPHASTTRDGDSWVASRDSRATDEPVMPWWEDEALPRVRYDAQALILDANPAAVAFLGRELVGHHWQEFVVPGSAEEVSVMLEILAEVGGAESRFRMPRVDGVFIEFDSFTVVEGEEMVTVMREIDPREP